MGMYDTVHLDCPHCGEALSIQTKRGECNFNNYTIGNLPPTIAGGLDGDIIYCEWCSNTFRITTQCIITINKKIDM